MNVTFKLKNSSLYAAMIGFPINTWRLYYGLSPWTGTNQSEWATTPYGSVPVDQSLTAYMGDQRYVMVKYNEGTGAHGQMAFPAQDFVPEQVYYLNMATNQIETGENIPPDTDTNRPTPGGGFNFKPLVITGLLLFGLVLVGKNKPKV